MGEFFGKEYKLKYLDELLPFKEIIEADYIETTPEDIVFRSTLTDPPTLIDSTPQSKRDNPQGVPNETIILTEEEVKMLTIPERKEFVGALGISVYRTRELCLKDIKYWVNRIAREYSVEEAKEYLSSKRGPFMVKLQLTSGTGLIRKKFNKKGHKNVLLNEGEAIDKYIKETYPKTSIEELLDGDILQEYNKLLGIKDSEDDGAER